MEKDKSATCELKEKTEELIKFYNKEGIDAGNIDFIGKVMDMHKDISNEEYWKEKLEMRYRNYSEYGEGSYGRRARDSRGRYMESFGRRGVPGSGRSYRGEDALEEMKYHYGDYSEGASYGGDKESDKSFEKMMDCLETFLCTIMDEADDPMKIEKIKKVARKAIEM